MHRPIAFVSAGAAALSLVAAGCGGSSRNVATVATPATARAPAGLLTYARCMRSHGVPTFPDPTSSGGISKPEVVNARKANPSRFDSADLGCGHLLSSSGLGPQQPTITEADRTDYLRAAACMRARGFPQFPDPSFPNNTVRVNIPRTIDQNSPQFKRAALTCTKLIPAGLPYSRPTHS